MIQISKSGLNFSGSSHFVEDLRKQFAKQNHIRLPAFLESELLKELDRQIQNSGWQERVHGRIGVEYCISDIGCQSLINFLMNDQKLFGLLEEITGCGHIGSFEGRIYRMVPGFGHHDSWHSDLVDHRKLSLSLNLGREPYEGGVLQMRDAQTREVLQDVPNTGFGDAIVFRLAPNLHHRVNGLTGSNPKTAFAGWFKSSPDFWSSIQQRL